MEAFIITSFFIILFYEVKDLRPLQPFGLIVGIFFKDFEIFSAFFISLWITDRNFRDGINSIIEFIGNIITNLIWKIVFKILKITFKMSIFACKIILQKTFRITVCGFRFIYRQIAA